jgi:16S rRNA (adenine1518-N6/adenine1519-N6)-dimethyltransferase
MVIHFRPKKKIKYKFRNIENLEKITNIFFSNKRKMIKKNLRKLLNKEKIESISNLNFNLRPEAVSPEFFYKITNLYES